MVAAVNTLRVTEIFGPTLQGEGPAAGRCALFVRLAGCNLSCSWCDTTYSWEPGHEFDLLAVHQIADAVEEAGAGLVILTGGEPLLQQDQDAWPQLLTVLADRGVSVHLETNGTLAPNTTTEVMVELAVVSPKLGNAGTHRGHQDPRIRPEWIKLASRSFAASCEVHAKFVCETADEVNQVALWATMVGWPLERTWVMPQGKTRAELDSRWPIIAEAAAAHWINATHRLHVLAWGNERGR